MGYYKDDAATEAAFVMFDDQKFYRTGDIGELSIGAYRQLYCIVLCDVWWLRRRRGQSLSEAP
jgi:hypothetical protein